jgi:hypothetical protein
MVQIGMDEERTKPCKPVNVLGKIRFYQNQNKSDFQPIDKPENNTKERLHNRISKFKMIIHLDRFLFLHIKYMSKTI